MEAVEAILTRRSVRAFTDEPVSAEELEVVLRAAMAAPSATNEQPWRFVVVRDRAVLDRLAKATPFAGALARAPLGIVVCGDKRAGRFPGFWVIDCAAAIENALLAAHATGLGGVWIGVHPVPPFVQAVRRIVRPPRHVAPMSMIALGHPAESKPAAERFEQAFVHEEGWGGGASD
jgi:nitroreductase